MSKHISEVFIESLQIELIAAKHKPKSLSLTEPKSTLDMLECIAIPLSKEDLYLTVR